jgi:hypothetical protein
VIFHAHVESLSLLMKTRLRVLPHRATLPWLAAVPPPLLCSVAAVCLRDASLGLLHRWSTSGQGSDLDSKNLHVPILDRVVLATVPRNVSGDVVFAVIASVDQHLDYDPLARLAVRRAEQNDIVHGPDRVELAVDERAATGVRVRESRDRGGCLRVTGLPESRLHGDSFREWTGVQCL